MLLQHQKPRRDQDPAGDTEYLYEGIFFMALLLRSDQTEFYLELSNMYIYLKTPFNQVHRLFFFFFFPNIIW